MEKYNLLKRGLKQALVYSHGQINHDECNSNNLKDCGNCFKEVYRRHKRKLCVVRLLSFAMYAQGMRLFLEHDQNNSLFQFSLKRIFQSQV